MYSSPTYYLNYMAVFQIISIFTFSDADTNSTGQNQLLSSFNKCFVRVNVKADCNYLYSYLQTGLKSPSYLLIHIKSAISITPFLLPYNPSPLPGGTTNTTKSTTESISISDWPTPTVSITTAS